VNEHWSLDDWLEFALFLITCVLVFGYVLAKAG
jgi:hypothetical protein